MFNLFKKKDKKIMLHAICDGDLIPLDQVHDQVFARKMMGEGFAIIPSQATIYSPVEGQLESIFPSQHAFGLKAGPLEILVHLGIDTVELNGNAFETLTTENQSVSSSTALSRVDFKQLDEANKDKVMLVIFTNGAELIDTFELTVTGPVKQGQEIGFVQLR